MRRWIGIAILGALLAAPLTWAQMRGGFAVARPGVGFHAPIAAHGSMMANRSFGFTGIPGRGFVPGGVRPPFLHPGFRFRNRRYAAYWWPYGYSYPLFWDTYDASGNAYNQQNQQLQSEVDQLSDEVERLRAARAEASAPPPPPRRAQAQPESREKAEPTTLVFRDGKTQQVQNYAIAGGSLWVFNDQRSRKIPLSELDVSATQKANEERGVSFHVPPAA